MIEIPDIYRMEAYDISNTNGFESISSPVSSVTNEASQNAMIIGNLRSKESKEQMIMEACGKCQEDLPTDLKNRKKTRESADSAVFRI